MGKHLTDAQIAHFREHGYCYPFDALTAQEAAACRARLEAYERRGRPRRQSHAEDQGPLAFPWLVELGRHPRILDAVEDLIGPDIMLFGASVFAKDGRDPRYVSWHQDSAYFGLTPHEEVTAWVAFTAANSLNGCMRVLPDSHRGRT